ncbi:hypothetical protein LG324_10340 [Phycicoccus jejuensis]|uniref:hypothetical protein n=1 Tax=Phycicoccus jejuensis TaxID=367299 RepID=UPI00384BA03C
MDDLPAAHVVWLLGQDEQWLRPRHHAVVTAARAAALCDVVASGAAEWVDGPGGAAVRPGPAAGTGDGGLVASWGAAMAVFGPGPVPLVQALDAIGPDLWDRLGTDVVRRGAALAVPRRVRRWRPPRCRPRREVVEPLRHHLLAVVAGATPAGARDEAVLASASCAGVLEHVLSDTAFTDLAVIAPAEDVLGESHLVARLEPAVSSLTSLGPLTGHPPPSG